MKITLAGNLGIHPMDGIFQKHSIPPHSNKTWARPWTGVGRLDFSAPRDARVFGFQPIRSKDSRPRNRSSRHFSVSKQCLHYTTLLRSYSDCKPRLDMDCRLVCVWRRLAFGHTYWRAGYNEPGLLCMVWAEKTVVSSGITDSYCLRTKYTYGEQHAAPLLGP
jgi:hypothetical protein